MIYTTLPGMKQSKNIALALGCAIICASFTNEHEYYVSVGEMVLNADSEHLEIAMQLFTDDLEYALEQSEEIQIDVLNDDDADEFIENYIESHFAIWSQDGKKVDYDLKGVEGDANAVIVYLESDDVDTGQKIQVQHKVLMDYFPHQINILKVGLGDNRLSYRFDADQQLQQIPI